VPTFEDAQSAGHVPVQTYEVRPPLPPDAHVERVVVVIELACGDRPHGGINAQYGLSGSTAHRSKRGASTSASHHVDSALSA
jgi:hypothetical protein